MLSGKNNPLCREQFHSSSQISLVPSIFFPDVYKVRSSAQNFCRLLYLELQKRSWFLLNKLAISFQSIKELLCPKVYITALPTILENLPEEYLSFFQWEWRSHFLKHSIYFFCQLILLSIYKACRILNGLIYLKTIEQELTAFKFKTYK